MLRYIKAGTKMVPSPNLPKEDDYSGRFSRGRSVRLLMSQETFQQVEQIRRAD